MSRPPIVVNGDAFGTEFSIDVKMADGQTKNWPRIEQRRLPLFFRWFATFNPDNVLEITVRRL